MQSVGHQRVRCWSRVARGPVRAMVTILAACTGVFSAGTACGQCMYEVTFIELPVGLALGINEAGNVCGKYDLPTEAFIWTPETGAITLERPEGVFAAKATEIANVGGIDGAGAVCGTMGIPQSRAFFHNGDGFIDLGLLPGHNWSFGRGINDAMTVVGLSMNNQTGPLVAFIWQDGVMAPIPELARITADARDINNAGQITGWMQPGVPDETTGFLWDNGTVIDIGPIEGGYTSEPEAMNDRGDIVGRGKVPNPTGSFEWIAFLWTDGQMINLGTLPGREVSIALGVNNKREVVGLAAGTGVGAGFLWRDGVMYDLNDLVPPDLGILIKTGYAINDAGQITAQGWSFDNPLLLTPVPPPPGDLTGDCAVSKQDVAILLDEWGNTESEADINGDGVVGPADLAILLGNWST